MALDFFNSIGSALNPTTNGVGSTFTNAFDPVGNAFTGLGSTFTGVGNTLTDTFFPIGNGFTDFGSLINDGLTNATFLGGLNDFGNGFVTGLTGTLGAGASLFGLPAGMFGSGTS